LADTNTRRTAVFALTALIIFFLNAIDIGISVGFAQPLIPQDTQHLIDSSIRQITLDVADKKSIKKVISVHQGEQIRLLINGKKAAVYHLHGYNLMAVPKTNHLSTLFFTAEHTGRYPLVVHQHDALMGTHEITIAYIEIKSR